MGASLDAVRGPELQPSGELVRGFVVGRLPELLAGLRPPADPPESRLLEAYERASLCATELALVDETSRSQPLP